MSWKLKKVSIAEDLGVHPSTYQGWEDSRTPDLPMLINIARKFHISLDDLCLRPLADEDIPKQRPLSASALLREEGEPYRPLRRPEAGHGPLAPDPKLEELVAHMSCRLLWLEQELQKLRDRVEELAGGKPG